MKRLQANPPKTEAEQQARVKQLQGEFVGSIKSADREGIRADWPASRRSTS